jgi:hypothetical protein
MGKISTHWYLRQSGAQRQRRKPSSLAGQRKSGKREEDVRELKERNVERENEKMELRTGE